MHAAVSRPASEETAPSARRPRRRTAGRRYAKYFATAVAALIVAQWIQAARDEKPFIWNTDRVTVFVQPEMTWPGSTLAVPDYHWWVILPFWLPMLAALIPALGWWIADRPFPRGCCPACGTPDAMSDPPPERCGACGLHRSNSLTRN